MMKCKFYLKAVAVLLSVGLLCPVVSGLYDVAAASAENIEFWNGKSIARRTWYLY